jgi:hypothetical protein
VLSSACQPELVIGTTACPPPDADQAPGNPDKVLNAPWATEFEKRFLRRHEIRPNLLRERRDESCRLTSATVTETVPRNHCFIIMRR